MIPQVLEGTWEEIRSHDAELTGRRVRLTILADETEKTIPEDTGETLDKALAEFIGVVKSDGAERLSERCGERFTEYLAEKHREGRL